MSAPDLSVLGASWPSDPRARRVLLSALRAMPDRGPWRKAVAWACAPTLDGACKRLGC